MHVASTMRRVSAHAIDELMGFIFWIPLIVYIWRHSNESPSLMISWKWILGLWVARMTYEILCIYVLQALPAQRFLGLKIISIHRPDMELSLMQAALRVLMAQFKYVFGPAIYFMALFHPERQHLGDIIAETQVVQFGERTFYPKVRFILGSILVYSSLVTNLSKSIDFVAEGRIQKEGVTIATPKLELRF